MQTWFHNFTLDDGRKVLVEWGYPCGRMQVESVTDEYQNPIAVDSISAEDMERLDMAVHDLDPFPPSEPYEP